MNEVIGQILPFALGVALSPVPIIAIVLMLATPRARTDGPAFLLGWVAGLTVLGAAVLVVAGGAGASDGGEPASWAGVLQLVLGLALLALAFKQWRGRPTEGEAASLPKWMEKIDTFPPGRALGLAVALAAVNPKNLLLTVGAATAIAQSGLDSTDEAVALGIFVLIASLSVAVPVVLYFVLGQRSAKLLGEIKDWMAANNATIMAVLLLILGTKLLGDGISAL